MRSALFALLSTIFSFGFASHDPLPSDASLYTATGNVVGTRQVECDFASPGALDLSKTIRSTAVVANGLVYDESCAQVVCPILDTGTIDRYFPHSAPAATIFTDEASGGRLPVSYVIMDRTQFGEIDNAAVQIRYVSPKRPDGPRLWMTITGVDTSGVAIEPIVRQIREDLPNEYLACRQLVVNHVNGHVTD